MENPAGHDRPISGSKRNFGSMDTGDAHGDLLNGNSTDPSRGGGGASISERIMKLKQKEIIDHNPQLAGQPYDANKDIFWEGLWNYLERNPKELNDIERDNAVRGEEWVFDLLPRVDQKIGKITVKTIKTKRDLPKVSTLKTTPRNISYSLSESTAYQAFYHQGIEMDWNFLITPDGRPVFDRLMNASMNNFRALRMFVAIEHFTLQPQAYNTAEHLYSGIAPAMNVRQALEERARRFGAVNKGPDAFMHLHVNAKRVMEQNGVNVGGIIMNQNTLDYLHIGNKDALNNAMYGREASRNRRIGESSVAVRGLRAYVTPQLDLTIQNLINSAMMRSIISLGSKFEFNDTTVNSVSAAEYRSGMRDISIAGYDSAGWVKLSILDVIKAHPAYYSESAGADKAGELNRANLHKFINTADTWLEATGQKVNPSTLASLDCHVIANPGARMVNGVMQPSGAPMNAFGEWSLQQCSHSRMLAIAETMENRLFTDDTAAWFEDGMDLMDELSNPPVGLVDAALTWVIGLGTATNRYGSVSFSGIPAGLNGVPYGFGNVAGILTIADIAATNPPYLSPSVAEKARKFVRAIKHIATALENCTYDHPAMSDLVPNYHNPAGMSKEAKRLVSLETALFGQFKMPLAYAGQPGAAPAAGAGSDTQGANVTAKLDGISDVVKAANAILVRNISENNAWATEKRKKGGANYAGLVPTGVTVPDNISAIVDFVLQNQRITLTVNRLFDNTIDPIAGETVQQYADRVASERQTNANSARANVAAGVDGVVVTPFHIKGTPTVEFIPVPDRNAPLGFTFAYAVTAPSDSEEADENLWSGSFITAAPLINKTFPLLPRASDASRNDVNKKGLGRVVGRANGQAFRSNSTVATQSDEMEAYKRALTNVAYPKTPNDAMQLATKYARAGTPIPAIILQNLFTPFSGQVDDEGQNKSTGFEEHWLLSSKLNACLRLAYRTVMLQRPCGPAYEAFHRNHIRIPLEGMAFRNAEQQQMESGLFVAEGPIGFFYEAGVESFLSYQASDRQIRIANEAYMGPFAPDNEKFLWAPFICGGRYYGGKGTKFITDGNVDRRSHLYDGSKLGDYCLVPVLSAPSETKHPYQESISIRGFYDRDQFVHDIARNTNTDDFSPRTEPMYPGVAFTNFWLNPTYKAPANTADAEKRNFRSWANGYLRNEICMQSTQLVYDHDAINKTRKIESSHMWGSQEPGMRAREQSQLMVQSTVNVNIESIKA